MPVIASSVGGIPEVIKNDISGVSIDGWRTEDYVSAILRILNDAGYRRSLVRHAKETFEANYTMRIVSSKFLDRYKSLV
jgi:glycosyltransferase involved in cell wall biosynthesis